MFDAKTHIRAYTDFHNKIIEKMTSILDYYQIDYDLISKRQIKNAANIPGKLLIVFSADVLIDIASSDICEHRIIKSLERLGKLNRPVIWMTAVENAASDFEQVPPNVQFFHYGGDCLMQMLEYPQVTPRREKNQNAEKFWISLSHAARPGRIMTAACLLGHNLGQDHGTVNGLLRISNHPLESLDTWQEFYYNWVGDVPTVSDCQSTVLQNGFLKIKNLDHGGQPDGYIYHGLVACDNVSNFRRSLQHLYANSRIEIVNETTFFTKGIFVTEKFLNSVYGYNLPIVMSVPGTVDYLRRHGFDMFDDVVDHSYDSILDPVQRIFTAVESNIRLLSDREYAIETWDKCLYRLDQNYQYASKNMYNYFIDRFATVFTNHLLSDHLTHETEIH